MANPPPPTQASSKTVTSIAIPFLRVVLDLDPTFERDKHDELMYPFGEAGHRARDFRGDPYILGAYAPPISGSPVNMVIPVISGAPVVGEALSVSLGTWVGAPTSFAYRWFSNNIPIIGAVSATYTPSVGDANKTITALVTAVNEVGPSAEAVSDQTGLVTFPQVVVAPRRKKHMSGLNRISFAIPGTSSTAAVQRDQIIARLQTVGLEFDTYHYSDFSSGLGGWAYYAIGYGYIDGITTVATVTCSGMIHPPSGSNIEAATDPGLGTAFGWAAVGAMPVLRTSGAGGGGGSAPTQNSGYNVWNIPGNSSTAAADFTAAIAAVNSSVSSFVTEKLFKYVDSVSGAWQVASLWVAPGYTWFAAGAAVAAPNTNIFYVVTCSGTPNPPTGSSLPPVTIPAFTQTFTSLSAPLSFGPQR